MSTTSLPYVVEFERTIEEMSMLLPIIGLVILVGILALVSGRVLGATAQMRA